MTAAAVETNTNNETFSVAATSTVGDKTIPAKVEPQRFKLLWDSNDKGTYIKSKHGKLGE